MRPALAFSLLAPAIALTAPPAAAQTVSEPRDLLLLPGYEMRQPTVAWDGQRFQVVFEAHPIDQPELSDLYRIPIDADGRVGELELTALELRTGYLARDPDLDCRADTGACLLGFGANEGPFSDVRIAWWDRDGAPTPAGGQALTSGAGAAELPPRVATSTQGAVVTWSAIVGDVGSRAFAQRFDAARAPLDEDPVSVQTMDRTEDNPVALGLGDRFLLGWEDARSEDFDLFVRTAFLQGPLVFAQETRVAPGDQRQANLALAPLGDEAFAIWQDYARLDPFAQGVRLGRDGRPTSNVTLVAQVGGRIEGPAIAGGPNGALAIWQELRSQNPNGRIRGTLIDTAGQVQDIAGFTIMDPGGNVRNADIAHGPLGTYLVVAIQAGDVPRLLFSVVETDLEPVPDPPDAGIPDTGRIDVGPNPRRDSGVAPVDAGVAPDAGADAGAAGPGGRDEGCRAAPSPGGAALWLIGLIGLIGLGRRRRVSGPARPR